MQMEGGRVPWRWLSRNFLAVAEAAVFFVSTFVVLSPCLAHSGSYSTTPAAARRADGSSTTIASNAIGVNYGTLGDNLPSPPDVAHLIQSTSIKNIRVYSSNPEILHAFSNTGINLVISVENEQIPLLAESQKASQLWVKEKLNPYYPASSISAIAVGNEILTSKNKVLVSHLVPAMVNLHKALAEVGLDRKIKISTTNSMAILTASYPPSSATFQPALLPVVEQLLKFLSDTGSSFMVNAYPFFAYKLDPKGVSLDFALFRSNPGLKDYKTNLVYANLFDAQVDAMYYALNAAGYSQLPIVVSETGWPSAGDRDEAGAGMQNAQEYNGNLVKHVTSNVGTPYRPKIGIEVYIFALFNENLKPGPASERNFGLFHPDKSLVYDAGLTKSVPSTPSPSPSVHPSPPDPKPSPPSTPSTNPKPPVSSHPPGTTPVWCIAGATAGDALLQEGLDFACGEGGADCSAIQPGQSCFEPNSLVAHASYAMNSYFQLHGRNFWNCYFNGTGLLTPTNPSYGSCTYPSQ